MNLKKYDLPVALFLILNPVIGFILFFIYIFFFDVPVGIWVLFLIMCAATNLSITAGYHRLFAHKSYETNAVAKFLLLLVGSSAFQGSALKWSSDHRRHHTYIDTDKDPYSIEKGFWYAHMGWLFYKFSVDQEIKALDLEKDKMIMHQHNHYLLWSIATGFVFPLLVGWILGSPMAGLIILGSLRIFFTQQSTFFVNSLCHTLGKQTYSKEISARDSFIVAILTHGEGYHNFHHQFQIDYRNGIKWYHWDPTKWVILTMKWTGLAKKLKTIPSQEILKARLNAEAKLLEAKGFSHEKIEQLKAKVLEAQNQLKAIKEEYKLRQKEWKVSSVQRIDDMKIQVEEMKLNLKKAKSDFEYSLEQWRIYINSCEAFV
jgi:stearoyl-CoA desaturase (delta-9 desaturase)